MYYKQALSFLLLLNATSASLSAFDRKEYVFVHASREYGMGSVLLFVFNLLCQYDLGYIQGVKLDFGKSGLYYDPLKGENWWEYYFEPLDLGTTKGAKIWHARHDKHIPNHCKKTKRLKTKTARAVKKYVHLKAEIQGEVDSFVAENYSGAIVLGVHYRGTDKRTEARRVSYEEMATRIEQKIEIVGADKIFVATDEEGFLNYLLEIFPGKVCYNRGVTRSLDEFSPLHVSPKCGVYEMGKNTIVDCILLSRTDFLLKTESNLSDCSIYFNENLPYEVIR